MICNVRKLSVVQILVSCKFVELTDLLFSSINTNTLYYNISTAENVILLD